MNFLVVNDDGYKSEGLKILYRAMLRYGNVYISAPKEEQSACSQRITIRKPIAFVFQSITKGTDRSLIIDGTPADCVRVGLKEFSDIEFDMVVSGVNYGTNLSFDTIYSGTLAAAKEASLYNIPAIAFSTDRIESKNHEYLLDQIIKILDIIIPNELYTKFPLLNINIPFSANEGIKVCKVAKIVSIPTFKKVDGAFVSGRPYINSSNDKENDYFFFKQNYITVSPIVIDQTDTKLLSSLTNHFEKQTITKTEKL